MNSSGSRPAYIEKASLGNLGRCLAAAVFVAIIGSTEAHAAAYCIAVPGEVLVGADGMVDVLTPSRGDWVGLCNIRTTWKGVDPSVCVSWFAMTANAVTQRKGLGVYYQELSQSDCASIETYERSPAPRYVRAAGS